MTNEDVESIVRTLIDNTQVMFSSEIIAIAKQMNWTEQAALAHLLQVAAWRTQQQETVRRLKETF